MKKLLTIALLTVALAGCEADDSSVEKATKCDHQWTHSLNPSIAVAYAPHQQHAYMHVQCVKCLLHAAKPIPFTPEAARQ